MKLFYLGFLFLLTSPQPDYQKIIWNEQYRLSWDDFLGEPNLSAGFVASTNTGINFGYSFTLSENDIEVEYVVTSFFSREKSWYIPGQVSQHILNHEQTHFDISELHARILRKRLASHRFSKNVKIEIENIYLKVETQRKAMQKKFDLETDHSRNVKRELAWEGKIERLLLQHDDWK